MLHQARQRHQHVVHENCRQNKHLMLLRGPSIALVLPSYVKPGSPGFRSAQTSHLRIHAQHDACTPHLFRLKKDGKGEGTA